uniref:Uncharacterized protein n=1 Tax=Anguilla anguilla TaxID=7936 RepID=A0A0E9SVB2_ANGAN
MNHISSLQVFKEYREK